MKVQPHKLKELIGMVNAASPVPTTSAVAKVLPGFVAGMDVGASRWRGLTQYGPHQSSIMRSGTARFSGLFALLDEYFDKLGHVPEVLVLALPGLKSGTKQSFSNLEHWRNVTEEEVRQRYGCKIVRFVNDLQAAAFGVEFFDPSLIRPLSADGKPARTLLGRTVVLTLSTGYNRAMLDRWSGLTFPREIGWNRPPFVPGQVNQYFTYVWNQEGCPAVLPIELAVAGGKGFLHMYRFLAERGRPTRDVMDRQIAELVRAGHGIGETMTVAAVEGDTFALRWTDLLASVLGADLHSTFGDEVPDAIYLVGSGIAGTPGFAELLVNRPAFEKHFIAPGSRFAVERGRVSLYVVEAPADGAPEMAAIGALEMAKRLAAG